MKEEKLNIGKLSGLKLKKKKKLNSDVNFHEQPQLRSYLSMSFIHSLIKICVFLQLNLFCA